MNRIGNLIQRHHDRLLLKQGVGAPSGKPVKDENASDPLNLDHLKTWVFSKSRTADGKKVYLHQGFHGQDIVSSSKHSWAAGLAARFRRSPADAKARFLNRANEAFTQRIDAMDLGADDKIKLKSQLATLLGKDVTITDLRGMFQDITKAKATRDEKAKRMEDVLRSLSPATLPEPPEAPARAERLVAAPLVMQTQRERKVQHYTEVSHHLRTMHKERNAAFRQRFGDETVDDFEQVFAPKIELQFKLYPDRFEQLRSEGDAPIKQFMKRELKARGISTQDLPKGLETLFNTTPLLGVLEKETSDALIGTCASLTADQSAAAVGRPRKAAADASWAIDDILRGRRTGG